MPPILGAGTIAPNFTLRVTPDENLTLSDLKGKNVIIAFYPADWRPVCGDQVTLYDELLPEFHKHDAESQGAQRFHARCAQRGEWHAGFLHQRRAT
jgi:peroxiredoxin